MPGARLVAKPADCIEEQLVLKNKMKENRRTNLNSGIWSKPPTGLGRGRLARAHACGRTSMGGCGADGSMVIKARGSRCPERLTHIRERRSICRKLSRTDLWLEFWPSLFYGCLCD